MLVDVADRVAEGVEDMGPPAQVADEDRHQLVARRIGDGAVEEVVGLPDIGRGGRGIGGEPGLCRADLGHLGRRDMPRRQPRRLALQKLADVEDLDKGFRRKRRHRHPARGLLEDQALGLEPVQRLADRRARGVEPFGHLALDDDVTGLQLAPDQQLHDLVIDMFGPVRLVGQRAVVDIGVHQILQTMSPLRRAAALWEAAGMPLVFSRNFGAPKKLARAGRAGARWQKAVASPRGESLIRVVYQWRTMRRPQGRDR